MSTPQKTMLLMLSALACIMLLTAVSWCLIDRVYDRTNYANSDTAPSLILLDRIRDNQLWTRIYLDQHISNSDEIDYPRIERVLQSRRADLQSAFKLYLTTGCNGASCVSDNKDQQYLYQAKVLTSEYDALIDPLLLASRKGGEGKHNARLILDRLGGISDQASNLISGQIAYNAELGQAGAVDAAHTRRHALHVALALAAVTLLVMAAIGWYAISD